MSRFVMLANGSSVPKEAVRALDELEHVWPGATLPQARAAIASAVLAVVIKDIHREQQESEDDLGIPEGYYLRETPDGSDLVPLSRTDYQNIAIQKIYLALADASQGIVDPKRTMDIARRAVTEACDNREGK